MHDSEGVQLRGGVRVQLWGRGRMAPEVYSPGGAGVKGCGLMALRVCGNMVRG